MNVFVQVVYKLCTAGLDKKNTLPVANEVFDVLDLLCQRVILFESGRISKHTIEKKNSVG